jgi:hypothetical protein
VTEGLLDPAVLLFAAGLLAGALRSDVRVPEALYDSLSVFLLLAIGLKGGVQLAQAALGEIVLPLLGTLAVGLVVPILSFVVLMNLGRFGRPDAAAIAAHYGSVSAVTFAVAIEYLQRAGQSFEEFVTVLLVVLEVPAIGLGILLARAGATARKVRWRRVAREIFLGKSVYLLLAGLVVGWIAGPARIEGSVAPLFFGLFKGALAIFLLEMGLVASRRLRDLRRAGPFLVGFGILMPLLSACIGTLAGLVTGLSAGGTAVLATLAASASYIAAPAAMRIAVPEANPTLYLTASLGVTFPFNIVAGIPLYTWMAARAHGL